MDELITDYMKHIFSLKTICSALKKFFTLIAFVFSVKKKDILP